MNDQQTYEGPSNGYGYRYGSGNGSGSGSGRGYGGGSGGGSGNGSGNGGGSENGNGEGDGGGNGDGNWDGSGWGDGYLNLLRLFPIPEKYHYLLEGQTLIQQVKIMYDLHNASNQEEIDILVEWYETVQDLDKAK